ncbi:MAG: 6-phosphofructokinase [Verrucomicrobia bacterium]|nr:6-phosphofructokinase [Verrucomicrobiota bacterium]
MPQNVLVAQSGGPSPVINSSLKGVIDACSASPERFGRIYGGWHGVEGILKEELLDISAQSTREIKLLRTTPAAGAIGTCRYKLRKDQEEDFNRIIEVIKAHNIGYLFYIGGNDSMDTTDKIARLAAEHGLGLVATGVPKTIDNDIGDQDFRLIDHTPGYGSVCRYWAYCVQNADEENRGACTSDPVLVMQVMGRKIGFIPAAARLADPERRMPLQIYMPEAGLSLEQLTDNVNDELRRSGRCLVIVSEGFDAGSIGERHDSFGHVEYGACEQSVQQAIVNHLNAKGLAAHGFARGQLAGNDQRDTSIHASTVDLEEAYQAGLNAVRIAIVHGSGWMSTILRKPGNSYEAYYDKVALRDVANSERSFPAGWIASNRIDVTDDFVKYASPLIGDKWPKIPLENGIQRFARFKMKLAPQKCPKYIPQGQRPKQVSPSQDQG